MQRTELHHPWPSKEPLPITAPYWHSCFYGYFLLPLSGLPLRLLVKAFNLDQLLLSGTTMVAQLAGCWMKTQQENFKAWSALDWITSNALGSEKHRNLFRLSISWEIEAGLYLQQLLSINQMSTSEARCFILYFNVHFIFPKHCGICVIFCSQSWTSVLISLSLWLEAFRINQHLLVLWTWTLCEFISDWVFKVFN